MKTFTKKILAVIVMLVLSISLLPMTAMAETSGNYEYKLDDEGNATITKYNGPAGAVTIPSELDEHPVTAIADRAFQSSDHITSVTFPSDLGTIGGFAFQYCKNITSLTFQGDVNTIGNRAFQGCDNLTTVTFQGDVGTISEYAFQSCENITSLTFQGDVGTIGTRAFQYSKKITSLTFPGDVGTIGAFAFSNIESLASVTFQGDVGNIGERAFQSCDNITSLTFPGDVGTIGAFAFYSCSALASVTFQGDVDTIGERAFAMCESLKHIYFNGTEAEWNAVEKGDHWNNGCPNDMEIHFSEYAVEVSASPAEGGSVTGGATYATGSPITVTATPNSGYAFVNWTEDGTEVSTDPSYSFTVEKKRSLVANFKEKPNPALSVTFYLTNSPDLPAGFAFGETANFGVTIINAGNTELTDVVITSDLTGDEWTFDSLAVYDIKTLQFSYDVTYDDVEAGSISTDAKATAKNPSDKATNINVADGHADTVATPAELTFDLGGGTLDGKTGSITVNANVGQKINLPGAPTKEGYKFLYWKGSEYAAGAEYTVEGPHDFTAEWEEVKEEPETKPDTSPKTGDHNNAGLWAALLGGSLLAVILLITAGRKYLKKQR